MSDRDCEKIVYIQDPFLEGYTVFLSQNPFLEGCIPFWKRKSLIFLIKTAILARRHRKKLGYQKISIQNSIKNRAEGAKFFGVKNSIYPKNLKKNTGPYTARAHWSRSSDTIRNYDSSVIRNNIICQFQTLNGPYNRPGCPERR